MTVVIVEVGRLAMEPSHRKKRKTKNKNNSEPAEGNVRQGDPNPTSPE